jgi:hypothetical protein
MPVTTQQVTKAALQLPDRERLSVATAIWKSLGASDETLADFAALARAQELDAGKIAPQTQSEVFGLARAALR